MNTKYLGYTVITRVCLAHLMHSTPMVYMCTSFLVVCYEHKIPRVHCNNKGVSSTPNAQHTYGVHVHLFPSGVL